VALVEEINIRAIVVQGLSILSLCAIADFISGSVFESMIRHFELLPGLIVMVPPLIDLRGNIGSAFGSRLGTALHTGIIEPRLKMTRELKANMISSIILSIIASATIGIMSFAASVLVGIETISVLNLVAIAIISGSIAGLIITFVTVFIAIAAYHRGWDPDNVTGPVMTTLGDIVTITCIYLTVIALWG
jgi:mgtE-like transporter